MLPQASHQYLIERRKLIYRRNALSADAHCPRLRLQAPLCARSRCLLNQGLRWWMMERNQNVAVHIFQTIFGVSFVVLGLNALDYMRRTSVTMGYYSEPLSEMNAAIKVSYLNTPTILGRKLQHGRVSHRVVLPGRVNCDRHSRERSLREGRADRVLRIACPSFVRFEFLGSQQFVLRANNQNSKK